MWHTTPRSLIGTPSILYPLPEKFYQWIQDEKKRDACLHTIRRVQISIIHCETQCVPLHISYMKLHWCIPARVQGARDNFGPMFLRSHTHLTVWITFSWKIYFVWRRALLPFFTMAIKNYWLPSQQWQFKGKQTSINKINLVTLKLKK